MKAKRRERGFTIIETLVAMTILLIGFLATAMLHVTALRANSRAKNRTLATVLASDQIERFQRIGYANVVTGTGTATNNGQSFSRSWTATTTAAGVKTVAVTVTWSDQWGSGTVTIPGVVRP